jgi:hypothetical protein
LRNKLANLTHAAHAASDEFKEGNISHVSERVNEMSHPKRNVGRSHRFGEILGGGLSHSPKLFEAWEWLRDPPSPTALLRDIPMKSRNSFANVNMLGYDNTLLRSGILKEVAADTRKMPHPASLGCGLE